MSRLIVLHVVESLNHGLHQLHLHGYELLQRLVAVVVVVVGVSIATSVHHLIEEILILRKKRTEIDKILDKRTQLYERKCKCCILLV